MYSACIQLVVLHDDDVYYMLFHMMMMCTLPVRCNWMLLRILHAHCLPVAIVHADVVGSHIISVRCYTRGLLIT